MTQTAKNPRIEIVDLKTKEVIHIVKLTAVSAANGRYVERVMRGLLQKLDTDKYLAREVDV